ncbi:MAG: hypothetical protein IT201_11070 [Thermoleophilia bacterium]|nr:hypothetical protein [Thermoleophilia bacterium]
MIRRALSAIVAAALALTAAGCASLPIVGEEDTSAEALALLERAGAAMDEVESMAFTVRIAGDMDGQRLALHLAGGGYLTGERAGEMTFTLSADAPGLGLPATAIRAVIAGDRVAIDTGSGWEVMPVGTVTPGQLELLESGFGQLDLARYLSDLAVERSTTFLGEPVTKIGATVGLRDLLGELLGQAGDSLGALGIPGLPEDALDALGDLRVVVYVSDTTGLVKAVHESLELAQDGHTLALDVDLVVDAVNAPVEIPDSPL